jgi:hypothetical protein
MNLFWAELPEDEPLIRYSLLTDTSAVIGVRQNFLKCHVELEALAGCYLPVPIPGKESKRFYLKPCVKSHIIGVGVRHCKLDLMVAGTPSASGWNQGKITVGRKNHTTCIRIAGILDRC